MRINYIVHRAILISVFLGCVNWGGKKVTYAKMIEDAKNQNTIYSKYLRSFAVPAPLLSNIAKILGYDFFISQTSLEIKIGTILIAKKIYFMISIKKNVIRLWNASTCRLPQFCSYRKISKNGGCM